MSAEPFETAVIVNDYGMTITLDGIARPLLVACLTN